MACGVFESRRIARLPDTICRTNFILTVVNAIIQTSPSLVACAYGEFPKDCNVLTTRCQGDRLGDWDDHSLMEDDPPAGVTFVTFVTSLAEVMTTHVGAQKQAIPKIRPLACQLGHLK